MSLSMPWATAEQADTAFKQLFDYFTVGSVTSEEFLNAGITAESYGCSLGFAPSRPAPAPDGAAAAPGEAPQEKLMAILRPHYDPDVQRALGDGTLLKVLQGLPWGELMKLLPVILTLAGK